jgi:hypothetical protein
MMPRDDSTRVFLAELINATTGIHDLLFARIEGMAVRTDFDLQIVPKRRARDERVPAAAHHGRIFVFGMNSGLHDFRSPQALPAEKGRAV